MPDTMSILNDLRIRITAPWDAVRILRAMLAMLFLGSAIRHPEPITWIAAGFFGLQSLLNIGCCGMGACQIERPARKGTAVDASIHNEVIP
jgi:hypothetical protein